MRRDWPNMPLEAWPEPDRVIWQDLLRDGDVLDRCGAGAHWAPATRRTLQEHYGCWLGWLAAHTNLEGDKMPEDRITPDLVLAYADALIACVAPKTVESYLRDLKVLAKAMAPDRDWRWLMDMANRLKHWARPSRAVAMSDLSAAQMFDRCQRELDQLAGKDMRIGDHRIGYRDTLLVAALICAPIRLRNLAMIQIGAHLQWCGRAWHLRFDRTETKTHQALHLVLHDDLAPHIDRYICDARLEFPGADTTDHLWVSSKGNPLADHSIYDRVRRKSGQLFDMPLPPHAFRTISATCLAESSPEDALHARPLLGHRSSATTERYYITAHQLKAAQSVARVLQDVRDNPGGVRVPDA